MRVVDLLRDVGDDTHRAAWKAWASPFAMDMRTAWDACPRGSWLLMLARPLGAEPVTVTLAAVAVVEELVLPQVPELLPRILGPLRTIRRAALMECSAQDLEHVADQLGQEVTNLALQVTCTINDDARARFERWGMVYRSLDNTAEELRHALRLFPSRSLWPTAGDVAAELCAAAALPRRRPAARDGMHQRAADLVREHLPWPLVEAASRRVLAEAPCWVDVAFPDDQAWQRVASLWLSVAEEKERGLLQPADPAWDAFLEGTSIGAAEFHRVLGELAGVEGRLAPAEKIADNAGRLGVHPHGARFLESPIRHLATLFGLRVTGVHDGTHPLPRRH